MGQLIEEMIEDLDKLKDLARQHGIEKLDHAGSLFLALCLAKDYVPGFEREPPLSKLHKMLEQGKAEAFSDFKLLVTVQKHLDRQKRLGQTRSVKRAAEHAAPILGRTPGGVRARWHQLNSGKADEDTKARVRLHFLLAACMDSEDKNL